MNNAIKVFRALRSFDRAASRAELERESELTYDQVHEGLRTLVRRGLLVKPLAIGRQRGTYQLVAGAREPTTTRGQYERTEAHRQMIAALVRARRAGHAPASYSPAAPPSHTNEPGALRIVIKGVLDLRRSDCADDSFRACALAKLWK